MKCLYGSYGVDTGSIVLDLASESIDMARATPQQVIQLRRREIAYVSQFLRAVPRVPALDVVAERLLDAAPDDGGGESDEAHHARRIEAARDQVRALFQRLNLPAALWDLPPATFSGGEQQRVNIARGFIQPARLLLLDEPTASLDAANRRVVVQLIQEAKARGCAVVGIFHDEEVRDAVATRCVTLSEDTQGTR
jgi:alpha-D-ribose 1-methylphosphonate 5-triphosphate synthase subunit PhnL